MSTRNEKIDIGDIFLDADKLTKFIVGASAIIGRIETHIGLPPMTAADYELYAGSGGLMGDTSFVGGSLMADQYQGGFFGWIYDKVIKPVKNAVIDPVVDKFVKPVINNVIKPVLGVARPILKSDAVQAAIGMMGPKGQAVVQGINTTDGILKTIGLGSQNIDGGAYRIQNVQGNAYKIAGAYKVQGRGTAMVPAQLRNTELDGDGHLVIGELYRFADGKVMIYTEQGFLPTHNKIKRVILNTPEEQNVTGGAYLENGEVKIASNHGLLGSTNRKCNGNSPSDFLQ